MQYDKVKVEVVATKPSLTFYSEEDIQKAGSRMWSDDDEWAVSSYITSTIAELYTRIQSTFDIGDPILHIELRRWADVVLVAPCSANTLSKIAHGLCDNLAVCKMMNEAKNQLMFRPPF